MNVALVAIAKQEDPQVEDWIAQQKKLGFAAIQLYDNSDNHSLQNCARKENSFEVVVIHFPGRVKQIPAQEHFRKNQSHMFSHFAAFDLDEILVLKKHSCINDFVNEHCKSGSIMINWQLFGDSGLSHRDNRPQYQRFVMREANVNQHVKYIVKSSDVSACRIHDCSLRNGTSHDTNGKAFKGAFNPGGPTDVAVLHHYFTKTKEEFLVKRSRGGADGIYIRHMSDFDAHNKNEVFDPSAWTFFSGLQFDAQKYAERYEDLKLAFGFNAALLWNH